MPTDSPSGSLQNLLNTFSIEVTSVDRKSVQAAVKLLPVGTEVFIANLPKHSVESQIETAATLRAAGLFPVPHIVARNLVDEAHLQKLLSGLAHQAGVDRALVLGGDREGAAGVYDNGLQLLQSGLLQQHGIRKLFLPCYPEGHPRIAEPVLLQALQDKLAAARQAYLDVTLVSQFCFDPQAIIAWAQRLESLDVRVPYRVGVVGPASRASLIKFALTCGIGPSLRILREREHLAENMLAGETPEDLLEQVVQAQRLGNASSVAGVHFFTFGSFAKTAEWITRARR